LHPVVPPPVPKSKPAEVPFATPAPPPAPDDSGTFQVMVPMAALVDFEAEVPMALPASAIIPAAPPVSVELTGPEVMLQPDGTARTTGGLVELSVTGGWLAARAAAPDGSTGETYLRLRRLAAITLRERPEAGLVLELPRRRRIGGGEV